MVAARHAAPSSRGRRERNKGTAYLVFLGFFFSFLGLLSLATKILPYVEIILARAAALSSGCNDSPATQWCGRTRRSPTPPSTSRWPPVPPRRAPRPSGETTSRIQAVTGAHAS